LGTSFNAKTPERPRGETSERRLQSRSAFPSRGLAQEEAERRDARANHHGIGPIELPAVDFDDELTGEKTVEGGANVSIALLARSPLSARLRDRERDQSIDAKRRGECEGGTGRCGDRSDVDWYGDPDHAPHIRLRVVPIISTSATSYGYARRRTRDAENVRSMQGSPPRRSRRRPPKKNGPSLPLVPIVIAVVVLGFVIGAGLSLAGRHDAGDAIAVASPTAAATIPPARPEPSHVTVTEAPASPSPSPIPSPSSHPTRSPSPSPKPATSGVADASASPIPSASVSAVVLATASPAATEMPSERPAPVASPTPPKLHPSAKPTIEPSATPVASTPAPATAAPASAGAASSFGRLAASVVRVYLSSVGRGDRDSAAAELASPPSGALVEDGIVDASSEIRHVEVHGTGDVVTVDVDLHTSSGAYAAQYTVKKSSTGAALIVDHSIVKQ
jgi:hypothetical protein